jgi:hypothetical protein
VASLLADSVLDGGLNVLDTLAQKIVICSQDPTSYTEATSTYCLGTKDFGTPGSAVGAPTTASPNGRKVTTQAITDGAVTANGTASKWAITGASANLYANGALASGQVVANGNTFTLAAFDIRIPNQP